AAPVAVHCAPDSAATGGPIANAAELCDNAGGTGFIDYSTAATSDSTVTLQGVTINGGGGITINARSHNITPTDTRRHTSTISGLIFADAVHLTGTTGDLGVLLNATTISGGGLSDYGVFVSTGDGNITVTANSNISTYYSAVVASASGDGNISFSTAAS